MEQGQIIFNDSGSPLFSIDHSNDSKIRSNKNRGRGNYYSPYNTSPRGGNNSSSPGHSSGQESPDFIPFGFSSPENCVGRGRGSHQWQRNGNGHNRFFRRGGFKGNVSPYQSNRGRYSSPHRGKRGGNTNPGHGADISLYYHHSMVENPWAELEENLNVSSPKSIGVRFSDDDKSKAPGGGRSLSESGSVESSNLSLTLGSQGEESVESGSDEVSS